MSGSTFGNVFQVTTWGESHGPAIGAVIDGCPAGLKLEASDIQAFLDRRKPGQNRYATKRRESDQVEILSGLFEGRTTGTPISLMVRNEDQRSRDYGNLASVYRPGHADYTYTEKYGVRDYRGGGRSSGRETAGRVAAGAVACLILRELGIGLTTFAKAIGPVRVEESEYQFDEIWKNPLYMPHAEKARQASAFLEQMMAEKNSAGGVIECRITGMPAGIGQPVFDKIEACLAKALLSIGAVKAFEVGDGTKAALSDGRENNDEFFSSHGRICKKTNHAGGILGGISDGDCITLRAYVKPTPSIAQPQQTVTEDGEDTELVIRGRHDPVIVPRAVVVAESMAAITLVDLLFQNMHSRMGRIREFYRKNY